MMEAGDSTKTKPRQQHVRLLKPLSDRVSDSTAFVLKVQARLVHPNEIVRLSHESVIWMDNIFEQPGVVDMALMKVGLFWGSSIDLSENTLENGFEVSEPVLPECLHGMHGFRGFRISPNPCLRVSRKHLSQKMYTK